MTDWLLTLHESKLITEQKVPWFECLLELKFPLVELLFVILNFCTLCYDVDLDWLSCTFDLIDQVVDKVCLGFVFYFALCTVISLTFLYAVRPLCISTHIACTVHITLQFDHVLFSPLITSMRFSHSRLIDIIPALSLALWQEENVGFVIHFYLILLTQATNNK